MFSPNLGEALSGGNLVALPLALAGGVLAGMNPCCLALYPAAAGACCSLEESQSVRRSFTSAVAFVLGIALAIATLGTIAAYVGRIADVGTPLKYAIAVIPIMMGIYRVGWVKVTTSPPKPLKSGFGGAFGTGLLLSLIIGPCGTPVLASVLSYAAYQKSFAYGGLLLFLYGLGNGLPLVLVGTAAGVFLKKFDCSRLGRMVDPIVGSSLLLLGFYLLWRI
jgi:cytochrome c-type biogenesis protein